jgi:hypothetical protein
MAMALKIQKVKKRIWVHPPTVGDQRSKLGTLTLPSPFGKGRGFLI